ncbi:nuclear protein U49 [Proboscivirus elephantidbeta4]|uniref:Nuclear protein U49 n=1 Tax=Elephant endotheliotropic herpesvirus 4 TaxID=548914 RepID=A0A0S1TQB9_9BETA|nr:nuclear protein U49 [Elephant endotheliotropic herpesvirus 4]ALM26000.1 nuclear protein U49 [Elephant endotheliotropic herpesvirus 4]
MAVNFVSATRKKEGVAAHKILQRALYNASSLHEINYLLGSILSQDLKGVPFCMYFESNMGRRKPDVVIVFDNMTTNTITCAVVEVKTTSRPSYDRTGRDVVQQYQLRQGQEQVRDVVQTITSITGRGAKLHVTGHVIFFQQSTFEILYITAPVEPVVTTTDRTCFSQMLQRTKNAAFHRFLQTTCAPDFPRAPYEQLEVQEPAYQPTAAAVAPPAKGKGAAKSRSAGRPRKGR